MGQMRILCRLGLVTPTAGSLSQHGPRANTDEPPEWQASRKQIPVTVGDDEPTRECDACHSRVPAGAFCGSCGADLRTAVTRRQRLIRPDVFVAAPTQPINLPDITSTLCPHLADADRIPFRHGIFIALAALVAASMLKLLAVLVVLVCLGIPLLFGLYLWRSDIFRDIPARAMLLAPLIGVALAVTWWVWTGSRLADSYDIPVSAGFQLRNVVNMGLAVNATDSLLMLVPAVLVRLLRLPSVESLDGFVIGAFGALAYTTGSGVTWLATQFTAGLLDNYDSGRLLSQAALYGIFDPLTAAAAGGMMGLLLWFRPARRAGQPPRLRVMLAICPVLGACYYTALYTMDAVNNPRWLESTISLMITVLALLTLRFAMQVAVLHELPDDSTTRRVRCIHCRGIVPDMPFCSRCGAAARASSRSARRLRLDPAVG